MIANRPPVCGRPAYRTERNGCPCPQLPRWHDIHHRFRVVMPGDRDGGRKAPRDWRRLFGAVPSLCFLLIIALALFYYANLAQPIQLATETPQLITPASISNLDVQSASQVRNGQVQLVVSGLITDPTVSQLTLLTLAPGSADWRPQAGCCAISGRNFAGTAVIGAPPSPLTNTQVIAFRLISSGDATEAQGAIAVTIDSFPSGSKLALNVVGVLSMLAILVTLAQYLLAPPSTRRSMRRKPSGPHVHSATPQRPKEEHAQ